jgi:hypothetical protein
MPLLSLTGAGSFAGIKTRGSSGGVTYWYDDSSDAHHTVTVNGTVTQSNEGGGVKAALLGNDGYIDTTLNGDLGAGDFTIEAWIKSDSYTADGKYLIDARMGSIWALGWGLDGEHDGLISLASLYGVSFIKSGIQTLPATWQHIAVVRYSGTTSIYINGQTAVANSDTSDFEGSGNLTIGSRYTHEANQFFNGLIAGLRIVKGTALYTSDFTVPTTLPTAVSGTQLLLNFGATAVPYVAPWYADASDAAHTVTLNGNVTQSDEGGGVKAALFNGSDGTQLSSPNINFGTSPFTIEGFFNSANFATANNPNLMSLFGQDNGYGTYVAKFLMYATTTTNIQTLLNSGSNQLTFDTNISNVNTNGWNHIAFVRGNGLFAVYINGILKGSVADDNRDFSSITAPFSIGYGGESSFSSFNGKIAGFRVVLGTALYTFTVPTTLPTAVSGTQLLLNFGATNAPVVVLNDIFTQASIDGSYNITPYSYTTHAGRFYQDSALPYTGTYSVTNYAVDYDAYGAPAGYHTWQTDIWFVVGIQVNVSGSLPSVSYTDGVYTITGDVDVSNRGLTSLHFADCVVTGNFNCSSNQLTSLQGAPSSVVFDFNCSSNQLTSLQYAPSSVGGSFSCYNNQLTSLQYAPSTGLSFNCSSNQLTSLQYVPSTIGFDFNCTYNQLTSLQYAPSTVGGNFYCSNNLLTSLQYAPSGVGGDFYCGNNQLTSLQGAPSSVVFDFNCSGNQLTSLRYAPSSVGGSFGCSSNQLTSLQYAPSTGLSFNCSSNQLTSLQYAPSTVGFDFNCSSNQLTSLQGAPSTVGGDFSCSNNQLTSLQYAPSGVGGNFNCSSNLFSFPIISTDVANVYWEYASNNTRKHATNHHYVHGSYYANVAVLVSGTTVLYTASDNNTVAANVTSYTTTNILTTNGSGVVTVSDLWFKDTSATPHAVTLNGSVTQSDEGGGVKAALVNPATLTYSSVNVGTGKDDSTVEFFIKFTNLSYGENALRVIDGQHTGEYTLAYGPNMYASSVSYPVFRLTSYYQGLNVDGFNIQPNTWYHVAIVRHNHVFKMYINGTYYPFVTQNGGGDFTGETWNLLSSTDIQLGSSNNTQNAKFAGLRAIKGTALYTTDFTAPTSLPTAVSGTKLLLNFGATNAPTV